MIVIPKCFLSLQPGDHVRVLCLLCLVDCTRGILTHGPLGSLSFITMGKPRFVHVVQSVPAVPACANSLNRAGGHPGPFSGKLDPGGPNWHRNPSVFSSKYAVLSV